MPQERLNGGVGDEQLGSVDANELYGRLLALPSGVPTFLITAHALRGRRLLLIQTELTPTLQGFDEIVAHARELQGHFSEDADLSGLTFLVERFQSDVEVAVEALLGGRHGVLANAMRDVMEMELLVRDFSLDPGHITKWLSCNENTRVRYFGPSRVRSRLAKALYSGQNVDLPDALEYEHHSKGIHATPNSPPDFDDVLPTDSEPGQLLFYSFEIIEHARRFFAAVYSLMRTLRQHDSPLLDRELPSALEAWKSSMKAMEEWKAQLPPGVFKARVPEPRARRQSGEAAKEQRGRG